MDLGGGRTYDLLGSLFFLIKQRNFFYLFKDDLLNTKICLLEISSKEQYLDSQGTKKFYIIYNTNSST